MITLYDTEQARMVQHAIREFPRECCGVILQREAERVLIEAQNIQDRFAPPTAEEAFTVDDITLLRLFCSRQAGWRVVVIYHSHTNGVPGMSAHDRKAAVEQGRPCYPGAAYVILSRRPAAWNFQVYVWQRGEYRLARLDVQRSRENIAGLARSLG